MPTLKTIMPSLKKALAITAGIGAASGAGYGGYKFGYRGGAEDMSEAMANAFAQQNVIENKAITNRFNKYNQVENRAIASKYLNTGFRLGLASKPATGATLTKSASDIYVEAFYEELEKTAISKSILAGIKAAQKAIKPITQSFKAGGKSIRHYVKGLEYKGRLTKYPKSKRFQKLMKGHMTESKRYSGQATLAKAITGGAGAGFIAGRISKKD